MDDWSALPPQPPAASASVQSVLPNALDLFPSEATEATAEEPPNPPSAAKRRTDVFVIPPAQQRPRGSQRSQPVVPSPWRSQTGQLVLGRLRAAATQAGRSTSRLAAYSAELTQRSANASWTFFAERILPAVEAGVNATARLGRDEVLPRVHTAAHRAWRDVRYAVRAAEREARVPTLLPTRLLTLSAALLVVTVGAISFALASFGRDTTPTVTPLAVGPATGIHAAPALIAMDAPSITPPSSPPSPLYLPPPPRTTTTRATPAATPLTVRRVTPEAEQPARPRRANSTNAQAQIQGVLNRYRDGFSTLDVAEVRAVWPNVDEAGLGKHFATLYDQNLDYDVCDISVATRQATALCRGSISYVLSGGNRRRLTQGREWRFTLRQNRGQWVIANAVADGPSRSTF